MAHSRLEARTSTTSKNVWACKTPLAPVMSWLQVCIELRQRDSRAVEDALLTAGALSIEYRNAGNEPLYEPAPGQTPLWESLTLTAMFAAGTDPDRIRLAIASALGPKLSPPVQFRTLDDDDWIASFNDSLVARQFGRNLWVCPSGSEHPGAGATVVELDPGLAFGTGSHATTALCLEWLEQESPGEHLLDYGCGSGILSVAALALGHARATAVDNDPQALDAAQQNGALNGMQKRLRVCRPDQLDASERFTTVVANILSNTLIELAPRLLSHCVPGTRIGLSGILTGQAPAVRAAWAGQVDFDPDRRQDGWVLLHGTVRH